MAPRSSAGRQSGAAGLGSQALSGKAAAEQEKREAVSRKARAAEEKLMAEQAAANASGICFEWQRKGKCSRNGCRFDHPAPELPLQGSSSGGQAAPPEDEPHAGA
ncbi:unnamed protein product, partial [Polarella glacialis]